MLGDIGIPELLIILVIVLVIFGAGKLPQIGSNLGKAIKSFKNAVSEEKVDGKAVREENIDNKVI